MAGMLPVVSWVLGCAGAGRRAREHPTRIGRCPLTGRRTRRCASHVGRRLFARQPIRRWQAGAQRGRIRRRLGAHRSGRHAIRRCLGTLRPRLLRHVFGRSHLTDRRHAVRRGLGTARRGLSRNRNNRRTRHARHRRHNRCDARDARDGRERRLLGQRRSRQALRPWILRLRGRRRLTEHQESRVLIGIYLDGIRVLDLRVTGRIWTRNDRHLNRLTLSNRCRQCQRTTPTEHPLIDR